MTTMYEVLCDVQQIRKYKDSDPELAHSVRDRLYVAVLRRIVEARDGEPVSYYKDLAQAALRAEDIKLKWDVCA